MDELFRLLEIQLQKLMQQHTSLKKEKELLSDKHQILLKQIESTLLQLKTL